MLGLVALPAALTLQTVHHPGRLAMTSANPTPLGSTISLSLFVVPVSALLWWLCQRRALALQHRACAHTLAVLVPLGFLLDLLFGIAFFTLPNPAATLGIQVPAVGGAIPLEKFLFSLVASVWCCSRVCGRMRTGWRHTTFPMTPQSRPGGHASCSSTGRRARSAPGSS